ncbi:MAG: hypothetical protein FJZ16_01485 [Candidatus Omnitrophica bacterium]|nr:hypothetical protein [Candidatus Omnitrophota bacterium]
MPNRNSHIEKAQHNEKFYLSFDAEKTDYKDWVVVGIFYSALHYIDAYFALRNKHPFAHGMRDDWVKDDSHLSQIWPEYRDLKEYRQKASYKVYAFSTQEIKNDIIPLLRSIKNYLQKLIFSNS